MTCSTICAMGHEEKKNDVNSLFHKYFKTYNEFIYLIVWRSDQQWRSQEFRLGEARLKDKIGNKKLI